MSQLRNTIIANLGGRTPPTPPAPVNDGILRFTIDTSLSTDTSNEHLKYSFTCGTTNSVNDYVIDWGDGETTIGNSIHYYENEGIYQIAISAGASGHFPVCKLGTGGTTSLLKVVSVDTPPDTFYNYVGENSNTNLFYNCRNLVSICSNFFVNNPQMVRLTNIFGNTYSLKTVPAGLFDNLTELATVVSMFQNSHIETVPNGLFRYNTKIYGFTDCFNGCEYLTLNKNIFCDEATEASTRFISPDIIIPYFYRTFQRSNFLGTTPGEAPSLWLYSYNDNRDASDNTCYSGAGNNATSITNYNSIPTTWGGPAS